MISKSDNTIGINVYSSKTTGIGGRIRTTPDGFFVSEILLEKTLKGVTESGNYAVFKLKKSGIDTNHALSGILRKNGLRLKALGLKDANAVTEQYVCSMNTLPTPKNITANRYTLDRIGFTKKPFTKKDMIGNQFKIRIDDADFTKVSEFNEYDKILNFYGHQRFGGRRPISHLIGEAIIKKNFEYAVEILLSFTSPYDNEENNEIRTRLRDKSNYPRVLNDLRPHMDIEKMVLNEMIDHGDALRALRAIPISLRRFFVQAYQSFIFNSTLSMAHELGESLFCPERDDVCYDKNNNLGRYQNDPKQKLALPIVGYSYSKKNRFDYEISKILEKEELNPKNFFVKEMQEVSEEGGFRHAVILCDHFSINEPYVSFTLSRGSYATIVLREIMKPEDPLAVGF